MLLIRNKAAQTTPVAIPATATRISFDTTVESTNSNLVLSDNEVAALTEGMYSSIAEVDVSNSSTSAAVTVTLTAYANGNPVPGATTTVTVAESGSAALVLPWVTKVIPAQSGTAKISWYLSGGAVNLNNAKAMVSRIL